MEQYTVKQLADMAGVSPRTLHYYDEIGLLKPSSVGNNGYRYYAPRSLLQLQQILFFRELDFSLAEIEEILSKPDFGMVETLHAHKQNLQSRAAHLQRLILTVDKTIQHLKGNLEMKHQELFEPFSEEKQKEYEEEVRRRYGDKQLKESQKRWGSYSDEKKKQIMEEGGQNYLYIVANMDKGFDSPEVQEGVARWHQHLRYFYEPNIQILRGLGDLYNDDPEFGAFFQRIHPDLAAFMRKAINFYCDRLEQKN